MSSPRSSESSSKPVRREGAEPPDSSVRAEENEFPRGTAANGQLPRRSQDELNTTQFHVTSKEEEYDKAMGFYYAVAIL
jgi:hypothetical protein